MGSTTARSVRLAVILAAIGLALCAQQLTVRPRQATLGWVLYAVASVLFAGAAWSREPRVSSPPWTGPHVVWRRLLWGLGAMAAVCATVGLSLHGEHSLLALLLWFASFGLASLAVRGSRLSPPTRPVVAWTRAEGVIMLAIVLVGLAVRTLWIDAVPRYYFGDEPRGGLFIRNAFRNGFPDVFTLGQWPLATTALALQGILAPFVGLNTTALRLSSSLFGTLAVVTTYLLARELVTPRIAMLAALLFACGRTAIDFSRMGMPDGQVPFFETLALACCWHAVKRGSGLASLWAGISLGLCLHTYNAGQFVPLLWAGWSGLTLLFAPRNAWRCWRGAMVTAAGFILTVLPFLVHVTDSFTFGLNWQRYTGPLHDRQIVTFVLQTWYTRGAEGTWRILRDQAVRVWLGFGVSPANAYALGYRGGGMLDHVSAPLFVLGLMFALFRLQRARYAFLVYWWLVTVVLLGVFTRDQPAFNRFVGLLPALAVFGAVPLDAALRAIPAAGRTRATIVACIAALLGLMAWDNWRTYFVAFPRATRHPSSELARYLAHLSPETTAFMLGAEDALQFGTELFQLNFPGRRFKNVPEPSLVLPLRESPEAPVALIFTPTQLTLADYAQALYPDAAITDVRGGGESEPMFRAMVLSPAQIAARQGLRFATLAADGTLLHAMIADPFAPQPPLSDACAHARWSGSV